MWSTQALVPERRTGQVRIDDRIEHVNGDLRRGPLNQAAENLQTMVRSTAESTQALAAAADELSTSAEAISASAWGASCARKSRNGAQRSEARLAPLWAAIWPSSVETAATTR